MWLSLVRNTEWSAFLDLVSPSFFDVLPPSALRGQAKELISNYVTRPRFIRVREEVQSWVEQSELPLTMRGALPKNRALDGLSDDARKSRGLTVLKLFFHQLDFQTAILDLRARAFAADGATWVWNPAPLYVKWEPDFLPALKDLYSGFYGKDDARFRRGLAALNLEPAEDVFREHFGKGADAAAPFKLQEFQKSFHEAFVKCRDAGKTLHGNFLPLGLYLATLYEHLEALSVPLCVGDAFRQKRRGRTSSSEMQPQL